MAHLNDCFRKWVRAQIIRSLDDLFPQPLQGKKMIPVCEFNSLCSADVTTSTFEDMPGVDTAWHLKQISLESGDRMKAVFSLQESESGFAAEKSVGVKKKEFDLGHVDRESNKNSFQ